MSGSTSETASETRNSRSRKRRQDRQEPKRLEFFHVPASAGPLFAQRANEMAERAKTLGPNPLRKSRGQDAGGKLFRPPDEHVPLPEAKLGKLIRDEDRAAGGSCDAELGAQT